MEFEERKRVRPCVKKKVKLNTICFLSPYDISNVNAEKHRQFFRQIRKILTHIYLSHFSEPPVHKFSSVYVLVTVTTAITFIVIAFTIIQAVLVAWIPNLQLVRSLPHLTATIMIAFIFIAFTIIQAVVVAGIPNLQLLSSLLFVTAAFLFAFLDIVRAS